MRYLAADFGSTYTKLTAVDAGAQGGPAVVGTASAFTTISSDVMEGYALARERLERQCPGFVHDRLLCCSSAAGGLAMVAVGLVPDLTVKAARMAAEGAGAKVLAAYGYELSRREQEAIARAAPDIVLLCGGTDGGNKDVLLANARRLCAIDGDFFLIAAGNKSADRELEALLAASGRPYVITGNVMPAFGRLDVAPARRCIRDIFIERIIDAKGLAGAQAMSDLPIIPTPLAVLKACEALSLGVGDRAGWGDFMAVDLGGATTDVYSMASGEPTMDNVMLKGLPEPFAKRTVEGDLGMRYGAGFLLDAATAEFVAGDCGATPEAVTDWVAKCTARPDTLAPENSAERALDEALARSAVRLAVERHCGFFEKAYSPVGELYTLTGKDLSAVPRLVGIGGVLVHSAAPAAILAGAVASPETLARGLAMPRSPAFFLDSRYIFSAMGLISQVDPGLALCLMQKEIKPVPEGKHGS
ncbi:MAG: glutamate mutase L [Desulfovibrio sp.]|jgi:uncharacterized protein (TIGR01319 family)|nr:glutamate mutase L [Desulfovibrio sp.]